MYADSVYATVRAWIEGSGSAAAAYAEIQRDPALILAEGSLPIDGTERVAADLDAAARLVESWQRSGFGVASICSEEYPDYLRCTPPWVCSGTLASLAQ